MTIADCDTTDRTYARGFVAKPPMSPDIHDQDQLEIDSASEGQDSFTEEMLSVISSKA